MKLVTNESRERRETKIVEWEKCLQMKSKLLRFFSRGSNFDRVPRLVQFFPSCHWRWCHYWEGEKNDTREKQKKSHFHVEASKLSAARKLEKFRPNEIWFCYNCFLFFHYSEEVPRNCQWKVLSWTDLSDVIVNEISQQIARKSCHWLDISLTLERKALWSASLPLLAFFILRYLVLAWFQLHWPDSTSKPPPHTSAKPMI